LYRSQAIAARECTLSDQAIRVLAPIESGSPAASLDDTAGRTQLYETVIAASRFLDQ
jgi:hypothetical protein